MFGFSKFFNQQNILIDNEFKIVMDLEKRLEIYRSEYNLQLDFKEKIYARMTIFSAFIMASITGHITMVEPLLKLSGLQLTIVIFIWEICLILLCFILYGLICLTLIKVDQWVNSNVDMENHRETLRIHYKKYSLSNDLNKENEYVDSQFLLYMVQQYSFCSSIIRTNNVYRQMWLFRIIVSTYILLFLTGIIGIFYVVEKI